MYTNNTTISTTKNLHLAHINKNFASSTYEHKNCINIGTIRRSRRRRPLLGAHRGAWPASCVGARAGEERGRRRGARAGEGRAREGRREEHAREGPARGGDDEGPARGARHGDGDGEGWEQQPGGAVELIWSGGETDARVSIYTKGPLAPVCTTNRC